MQTEEKNNETKRSKQKKKLSTKVFSFISFIFISFTDHGSMHIFFYINSLHCFLWFFLYYLLHLIRSDRFAALTGLQPYKLFIWIYELFKNHPWKRVFRNVSLSNLENVLQGNLKTDCQECMFRVSEGANFENFSAWHQSWWCLCGFDVCTGLPKKSSRYITDYIRDWSDYVTTMLQLHPSLNH